ncbi:hypothetical protein Tco_0814364 [Tanacetum coccineum]
MMAKSQRAERIGRKLHTYAGTEVVLYKVTHSLLCLMQPRGVPVHNFVVHQAFSMTIQLRTRPRDCLSFMQYVEISTLDAGTAMEEYVRESPRASNVRKNLVLDEIGVGVASHPRGVRVYNFVVHLAFSMVGCESMKIYNAISDGSIKNKRICAPSKSLSTQYSTQSMRLSSPLAIIHNVLACDTEYYNVTPLSDS